MANSQRLSIAMSLRAWTGAAAAAAVSAAASAEGLALKHAASHKKAANNMVVSKKAASKRAPAQIALVCFQGYHVNAASASFAQFGGLLKQGCDVAEDTQ